MSGIFLSVLNMSLTGGFVAAAVMLARLPLKKAPRVISYALWAVVGFRLVFPFTLESVFSLLPFNSAPIPQDIAMQAIPRFDSGIPIIDNGVSAGFPAATPQYSANPLQIWTALGAYVWIVGIAAMLIHCAVTTVLLARKLRFAAPRRGGDTDVYEADGIKTPLVFGLLRPRIYLPTGLSEEEGRYILLHERTHIKRRDHLFKMFAFLVLCVHWFNPLVWTAFALMTADMEMSCDERVMRELGGDIKEAYSLSLARMAVGRRILNISPLFGEGGMKERVKNVLNFKKPSRIVIAAAVAFAAVLSAGFAVDGARTASLPEPGYYDFSSFSVNGIMIGADAAAIDTSHLTPTDRYGAEYDFNFEEVRYSAVGRRVARIHANVYDGGAYIPSLTYGGEPHYIPYNFVNIEQVVSFLGDYYEDGWYDREQGLRFIKYDDRSVTRAKATEVTFVYSNNGSDGMNHRLVWVIADVVSDKVPYDYYLDIAALSALRTPYVGDNSAVGKIIDALPPLTAELRHRFFSIGDDYGTGAAPYTLTLYYEQDGGVERNITVTPKNATLLFALIDNLEEVSFAFRETLSGGELDKAAYTSRITCSKENIDEYIGSLGLTWEDFENAWSASVEKLFAPSGSGKSSPQTMFEIDADNGNKMTLYSDVIEQMLITHFLSGQPTGYGIADKRSIELFKSGQRDSPCGRGHRDCPSVRFWPHPAAPGRTI